MNDVKVYLFNHQGTKCIGTRLLDGLSDEDYQSILSSGETFWMDGFNGEFQIQSDAQWKPDAVYVSAMQVGE